MLDAFVEADALVGKFSGAGEEALVSEKLGALLTICGEPVGHNTLESLGLSLWDRVPELGCAEMYIVDGIEVGIFYMPREGGAPCAKVEIGLSDAWNAGVGTHAFEEVLQIGDVPAFGFFSEE